jgi:hypothetical protein
VPIFLPIIPLTKLHRFTVFATGSLSGSKRGTLGSFRRWGMANDFKSDVFLSHSSKDKAVVRTVAEQTEDVHKHRTFCSGRETRI